MKFVAFPLLFLCFAASAEAKTAAQRNSAVRVLTCVTGEERSASFQGDMKAYRKATGLEMRFSLHVRTKTAPMWKRVAGVEGFDTWAAATPGVKQYLVDKEITDLPSGASYRTVVKFRWRNASGTIVGRALKRSKACRQPDTRANLKVQKIDVRASTGPGLRIYTVRVANKGATDAPAFMTSLQVNGETRTGESGPLAAGAEADVEFEAPACSPGTSLIATADTTSAVDESLEMDNGLTLECPLRRRR